MPVQKSTYISAGGHALLLGYALFGGLFNAEPLELPTVDVSVVSEAEFAALTAAQQPPDVSPQAPAPQLAEPEPEPEPVIVPEPEVRPEAPQIVQPEAPAPQPAPEPAPEPLPEPEPEPEPAPQAVVIPDATLETSLRPKPRPADRVAPEPVAAPAPEAEIDNTAQEASAPDEAAEQTVQEQSQTAPEEAATEIVTEAEEPAASAPQQSVRPRPRPRAAAAAPQESTASDVTAALAEALGEPNADEGTDGPPLTAGETNALRLAVQNCWVVDVGSQASDVTVVLGMSMDLRGKVVPGTLRLVSSTGGEGAAVETAFQAARRAVLRCQKEGYDLPEDKYEQWKEIEITFNPKDMRVR